MNPYAIHSLGIDPGFGSSRLTEHLQEHDTIRVFTQNNLEETCTHPDPQMIINKIFDIHRQYYNLWVFCDGSNRGFVTSLKIAFGENINYESPESVSPQSNKIIPINFSKEHKTMISHLA